MVVTRLVVIAMLIVTALAGARATSPQQADRRLPATQASPGRRLALVVGINTYQSAPLRNAAGDARAIAGALRELAFDVTELVDATLPQIERVVATWTALVTAGDVALFYYAGHGIQVEGENYLVPVDFRFAGADEADAKYASYPLGRLQEKLAHARVKIIILDACRDNPFRPQRSARAGLAPFEARGAIVAYATAPGSTASDNPTGGNGLFTAHLLEVLRVPGLSAVEVFRRVRQQVYDASGGRQTPYLTDGLIGEFVFRPATAATPAAGGAATDKDVALRAEVTYWESVKDSRDAALVQGYLDRFSNGMYSDLARARLAEIAKGAATPAPTVVSPPAASPAPVAPAAIGSLTLRLDAQTTLELVRIAPGRFQMGSDNGESDEKPVHQVTIRWGFELGKYEVTQAQWAAVMGSNPSQFTACGGGCPVEQVSWDDVQTFIGTLNARRDGYTYRLPTEAEWEYAARAGTTGDYAGNLDELGWYDKNAGGTTHPVGQKRPNAWGLYDMHGNVWEWVSDWSASYPAGSVTDPTGASSGAYRVFRGGSWGGTAGYCRSADRGRVRPGDRGGNLGFRLLRVQSSA
jgi:formylglycine-generating enzyme required for sulfatase activity